MSTYISDSTIEWRVLADQPEARAAAAWDYARAVLGGDAAATWFLQPHPAVLEGRCTVAAACRSPEGFVDTIGELVRVGINAGQPLPSHGHEAPVASARRERVVTALPVAEAAAERPRFQRTALGGAQRPADVWGGVRRERHTARG